MMTFFTQPIVEDEVVGEKKARSGPVPESINELLTARGLDYWDDVGAATQHAVVEPID